MDIMYLPGRYVMLEYPIKEAHYEQIQKVSTFDIWMQVSLVQGYCVSTVGLDEDQIRKYVRQQEEKDKVAEQVGLWDN